jgi:hypothetical protein
MTSFIVETLTAFLEEIDLDHPLCSHPTNFTVSRIVEGYVRVICEACFTEVVHFDRALRINSIPIIPNLPCVLCSRLGSRFDIDLSLGICDTCRDNNEKLLLSAEENYSPLQHIMPDEISPGLYIGAKETAYNRDLLKELGITHILICCDRLPACHIGDSSLRYHRIPIQDSLSEELTIYLPSTRAFISAALLSGGKCLVHCNAGVSRSGSVVIDWIFHTHPEFKCIEEALQHAKTIRPIITPNSNFLTQLAKFHRT